MSKSFPVVTGDVSKALGELRSVLPESMKDVGQMLPGVLDNGTLGALCKEVTAPAICVCRGGAPRLMYGAEPSVPTRSLRGPDAIRSAPLPMRTSPGAGP